MHSQPATDYYLFSCLISENDVPVIGGVNENKR